MPESHRLHPCRVVAEHTVTGALQLLRYGATLASRPHGPHIMAIQNCASLALAHVCLLESQPRSVAQVPNWTEMLPCQPHLLALLAWHIMSKTG